MTKIAGKTMLSVGFILLSGCSGSQRRNESIVELKRLQSAIHEINIVVSAGVTRLEYSQRLADALVKMGDLQESVKRTAVKFPKSDQATVEQIYVHLNQASEAYRAAKEFFGTKFEHEITIYTLSQTDYDRIRVEFPNLDRLQPDSFTAQNYPGSPPEYLRSDMLHALWKLAGEEDAKAKQLIDQLEQK